MRFANLYVTGGQLTILPGTAIGLRNEFVPAEDAWTSTGFRVSQGGSVTSHGTPTQPNRFVAASLGQEALRRSFYCW
jgi:hypothetical protein